MRFILASIVTVASLYASPALAQTSDYLAFNAVAEEVARISTSVQSCKHFGFDVIDGEAMTQDLTDAAGRRAVLLGVDTDIAASIIVGSIRDESKNMDILHKEPSGKEDQIQHVYELADFWYDRCMSLSEGEFGSKYIRKTGNENQAKDKLIKDKIDLINSAIEQSASK